MTIATRTIISKDILYPRTMWIPKLNVTAVFVSKNRAYIVSAPELSLLGDNVKFNGDVKAVHPSNVIVGHTFTGCVTIDGTLNGEKWKAPEKDNLLWDIETRTVVWVSHGYAKEGILVDKPGPFSLGEEVDVKDYGFKTKALFTASLHAKTSILVQEINSKEVVLFQNKAELTEYCNMVVGYMPSTHKEIYDSPLFPEDFIMEFPLIQSKLYSFPVSHTKALLLKKSVLHRLMDFSEWKKSRG